MSQVQTPTEIGDAQTKRPGTGRKRLKRVLVISVSSILILLVVVGGFSTWFVRHTLPQTTGTLSLKGLQSPVEVTRDNAGIPALQGTNMHDVMLAQGYVTAQDRLFQMEMNRRIMQGRLAETFGGADLVKADEFLRTVNLYQVGRSSYTKLDAQTKKELQAYADGVNLFIETHKNALPLEFTLLGITPEQWTPVDSLAYGGLIAFTLNDQWYNKFARGILASKISSPLLNQIYPPYPGESPTLIGGNAGSSGPAIRSQPVSAHLSTDFLAGASIVHTLLGSPTDTLGSNGWVVDGTKTRSGKPLLANDPHLAISMPSIWYQVSLHWPGVDMAGFSFPGVPGVIIGNNNHIAWGMTDASADVADLYVETLDPQHYPGMYKYAGQWLPLQSQRETIKVRGAKSIAFTIVTTRHGPLLNDVVDDLKNYRPVAFKWTALQTEYDFTGFFKLDYATDWQQFKDALAHISIDQNFMYADTAGNIGYRMSGLIPLRNAANGEGPVDGSNPQYEWHGYIPQDQMPTLFNPATHVIATANNRIVTASYPYYISNYWDQGYRAERILDLLNTQSQLTPADFARIQQDVYSIPAAKITPYLVSAGLSTTGNARQAAILLQHWDDTMQSNSVAATIYEVTAGTLLRNTLQKALGKENYLLYYDNYGSSGTFTVLINLLEQSPASIFPQGNADRDTAIKQALSEAISYLKQHYGSDPTHWQWGVIHQAHFDHPLATVTPLNLIFGVNPVQRPGDNVTINVGGVAGYANPSPNFAQNDIPSMRTIVDLSNFDNSRWIISTGASGQPFSNYYKDQLALWKQGKYLPLPFSMQARIKNSSAVLTLQPG